MDYKSNIPQRGAPRSSRLPLPRTAVQSTLPQSEEVGEVKKTSRLPRPSGADSLRSRAPLSQDEDSGQTPRSKYGWTSQQPRSYSPANVVQDAQISLLETTPPSVNDFTYVEGDENASADNHDAGKFRRRPRPSLSERALETLSHIPPSPSPTRRRPSIAGTGSTLRPPSGRSIRTTQSNISLRALSASPSKQLMKPSAGYQSSTKEVPPVPSIPTTHQRFMPVKQYGTGSGIDTDRPVAQTGSHAAKAKTLHTSRLGSTKNSLARPPLDAIFKDPPPRSTNTSALPTVSSISRNSKTSLVIPQSREKPPTTPLQIKASETHSGRGSRKATPLVSSSAEPTPDNGATSSLTLRETIARAKAAKRGATNQRQTSQRVSTNDAATTQRDEDLVVGNSQKTLLNRIRTAVTTGSLNIAAMGLKELPRALLSMYDFDENSKISWAETVDLVKFIAADNEFDELHDDFFPDWSVEELQNDEGKTNYFGGLQVLNLRGNSLKSIPVGMRRLGELQTLTLSNNKLDIEAFDVLNQMPNLKELVLANNNIQGIIPSTIGKLQSLQVLDLHANRLSSLPESIANLGSLQRLDLSDNAFESLPLEVILKLPLVELNLSKNKLVGNLFPTSCASRTLATLNIATNRLQTLGDDEFDFPNLKTLVCDSNQISQLPNMTSLVSLTSLTASENQIAALPEGFTALSNLRTANLSANQIRVVDPLISRMDNLTAFNVSANPLRDRKYLTMDASDLKVDLAKRYFATSDDSVHDHVLGTSGGHQETLPTNSDYAYKPERGVLNLSSQSLPTIDLAQIDLSQPIHTVRLSNNDLTTFPGDLLAHPMINPFLKSLDLSHNQSLRPMAYLTERVSLPALESLYIVSTGLTTLDPLTEHLVAPQLKELNISCHRMTGAIPCVRDAFPSLTTLLATDNWFTSVEVENVRGLEVLDIRNNDIEHLPPKLGELGNADGKRGIPGRLRALECSGNRFRVPRQAILDRGTEAVLKDLRRMVPEDEISDEWRE